MDESRTVTWAKLHKKAIVDEIVGDRMPKDDPTAIIMAGIPGAGKTEFLSHIVTRIPDIIIIDLDVVVGKFPNYRPGDYYKFRTAANILVSALVTRVLKGGLSFALDGTFAHEKGAENIARALKHGFDVNLFFVDQEPAFAWKITKARRLVTGRPVERSGFLRACSNVVPNVRNAIQLFRDNERGLHPISLTQLYGILSS